MNTSSRTSNVVEPTPMIPQKKSLIDLTPIPPMNVDHFQVDMMNQGQSSNPPMNQTTTTTTATTNYASTHHPKHATHSRST